MRATGFRAAVIVLGLVLAASWANVAGPHVVHAQRGGAIFDGVYTAAQAARGKARFEQDCATCHRETLTGASGPPLKGATFMKNWEFLGLNALVSKVFDTMPQ